MWKLPYPTRGRPSRSLSEIYGATAPRPTGPMHNYRSASDPVWPARRHLSKHRTRAGRGALQTTMLLMSCEWQSPPQSTCELMARD